MHKVLEIGLAALAGAVVPAAGAIYIAGGQANRVEQLERRIAVVEQRPIVPSVAADPAKMQCAKLAERYASPESDRLVLKQAMDALACFRVN